MANCQKSTGVRTSLAALAAIAASTLSAAFAETSTAYKGRCGKESVATTITIEKGRRTTIETPVVCEGALVLEQDNGFTIVSFLTPGDTKAPMHSLASPGFDRSGPRGRKLPISGIFRLEGEPDAEIEVTPSSGQCEFSTEAIKNSEWILCSAKTSNLERAILVKFAVLPAIEKTSTTTAAQDKSYLVHNGSEIVATFNRGQMRMYYEKPKPSLAQAGIYQGTLLFQGTAVDGHIRGTAFAFKKGCPPTPYEVEGRAQGDVGFELSGPGPQFGKGCAVLGLSWSSPHARLVFVSNTRSSDW